MKVLLAGGGTGGHIYPAIAIANEIKKEFPDAEIQFAGRDDCMEADIVPKAGYSLNNIRIYGFERYYSKLKKASVFIKMFRGLNDARRLVKRFDPDIVIGTGGFVSGPVVLAGALRKKPTLIHEQNATPGFTTKVLSKYANIVCSSFENTKDFVRHPERVINTGNPVRGEFGEHTREKARESLGIPDGAKVIVAFGGSLGAKNINDSMIEVIRKYVNSPDVFIYHATGKGGYDDFMKVIGEEGIDIEKAENVVVKNYVYNMPVVLNAADIVVTRSGAGAIAEVTFLGKAGIYIPYPLAADDHQRKNAEEVERVGAGKMILDADLNGRVLLEEVDRLLEDSAYLEEMSTNSFSLGKRNSAELIVNEVKKLV